MLEKFKDMGKLLKQAQEMKSAMKKVQEELAATKIPVATSGGKIKILITGELEILEVEIDPSFLDPKQKKSLQDGLKICMTDAIKKAKDIATSKLATISGGLLPGQ